MSLREDLKKEYEVNGNLMGPGVEEVQEDNFLGRTIRWTGAGLEWECDQKVVKGLLEEAGLGDCNGMETPGMKVDEPVEERALMEPREATLYRRGAAKANYLAQDRVDIGYASKELSRNMANPRVGDELKLKRLARYLAKYPRCIVKYDWQEPTSELLVFTDSDWGGCQKTRKSTSGGCLMKGSHLLLFWSRTQQLIAFSSAEAELNASIKAGVEGLGVANMAEEMGKAHKVRVLCDHSANVGISHRAGAGKVKHLGIRQLWLQERVSIGDLTIEKIPRAVNSSDTLTHHWTAAEGKVHFGAMQTVRCGH